MKKISVLAVLLVSLVTFSAQAFLVEEHCDDYNAFSISNDKACEELCSNNWRE